MEPIRAKRQKSPQSPLGELEYQALGKFRKAMREFMAFSETAAREQGLTSQQHQALLAIRSHFGPEAMTIGELAASLIIKNHSAVGLVGRLIERDLVNRATSETDHRRVLLTLSDRGAQLLEVISLRNLGQLNRAGEILREIADTTHRLEETGAWRKI